MTATSLEQQPSIKLSAKTLDNYAAAAGRKYMNICSRLKQKIKSVPALDKAVQAVKNWDQKMTQKHDAAYKYAKGAVIGTTIGLGLVAAGAEVATAYAAVNAVRAVGGLLAEAEKSRQEGTSDGFSDFASKNKMAVGWQPSLSACPPQASAPALSIIKSPFRSYLPRVRLQSAA